MLAAFVLFSFFKTRKYLVKAQQEFAGIKTDPELSDKLAGRKINDSDLYCLSLYGVVHWQLYSYVLKSRDLGQVLRRFPGGKIRFRKVKVKKRYYDRNGKRVGAHSTSNDDHWSSGGSGGFSGGGGSSFGGGSSGGGGATGGW